MSQIPQHRALHATLLRRAKLFAQTFLVRRPPHARQHGGKFRPPTVFLHLDRRQQLQRHIHRFHALVHQRIGKLPGTVDRHREARRLRRVFDPLSRDKHPLAPLGYLRPQRLQRRERVAPQRVERARRNGQPVLRCHRAVRHRERRPAGLAQTGLDLPGCHRAASRRLRRDSRDRDAMPVAVLGGQHHRLAQTKRRAEAHRHEPHILFFIGRPQRAEPLLRPARIFRANAEHFLPAPAAVIAVREPVA